MRSGCIEIAVRLLDISEYIAHSDSLHTAVGAGDRDA